MGKISKDNFAETLKITNKYAGGFNWHYSESHAINMVDNMKTKTSFIVELDSDSNKKINYDLIITIPIETTVCKTRFGDEVIGREIAEIHLVFFEENQSLGKSRIYKYYSLENYREEIQKIWTMLKCPVYCIGEKYNGYGFKSDDEHIFLFNKLEKYETFKAGSDGVNIKHFTQVVDMKWDLELK